MASQSFAANGEPMSARYVQQWIGDSLGFNRLPKGFVGFDIKSGLARVVLKPDTNSREISLGKFLKKGGFEEGEINEVCRKAACLVKLSKAELKFATTEEEIVKVYKTGPNSCMRNCDSVRVYATEDVAVAYLELDDEIVARSVVCINKDIGLQYVRAYGLVDVMVAALERGGYVSGSLEGCKLRHILDGYSRIVMPYLDGGMGIYEPSCGDEFVVASAYGDIRYSSTSGTVSLVECLNCNAAVHEGESYYSEALDGDMCETCFTDCDRWWNGRI